MNKVKYVKDQFSKKSSILPKLNKYMTIPKTFSFLKKHLSSIALFTVLIWVAVASLWNLQVGSLQPWDEAWYGSISRNMLESKNPFLLSYNQKTFYDHPPLGFQLKAVSMALLGENSFAVRLPEVLAGILSVALVFIMGRRLSSSWAGFWAAVMLLSSRWFLFRARSGNLDVLLLATQLLVITCVVFLLFPSKEKTTSTKQSSFIKQHIWLWAMWFSLSLSLLSKSLISLQLLPIVGISSIIYWLQSEYTLFQKERWLLILGSIFCLLLPITPWFLTYYLADSQIFIDKQLTIGFRSGTEKSINPAFITTAFAYFNAATHKWYKVMLGSMGLAAGLLIFSKNRGKLVLLLTYAILVAGPYVISEKTEVWHLVPLVGAMALLAGVALDITLATFFKLVKKPLLKLIAIKHHTQLLLLSRTGLTAVILVIAVASYVSYWKGFISVFSYPADYQKIMTHLTKHDSEVFVTTDAYFPGFVYYANLENAPVTYISDNEYATTCRQFANQNKHFQAVGQYGGWLMNQTGDTYLKAREGGLVLIDMKPTDCKTFADETLGPEPDLLQ